MNIRDREDELFSEWEKSRKEFVRDGVVSEDYYKKSNPKIALILKDPHGDGGGDIRTWIRDKGGGYGSTWNDVVRLIWGIRNREKKIIWRDFPNLDDDFRFTHLRSICAMNLKKSVGGASTDSDKLRGVALKDKKYIQEQYALYDPDITICGSSEVYWLFRKVFDIGDEDWENQTSRGVHWYERSPGKYVIESYHPAARISSSLRFYQLIDAVNEIYKT